MGLAMSQVMALRAHDVMGYDTDPEKTLPAVLGPVVPGSMSTVVHHSEAIFVCVPRVKIVGAVTDIARHSSEPVIVIIPRWLLAGEFEEKFLPIVKGTPVHLVYMPYLANIWSLPMFVDPDFVLVATPPEVQQKVLLLLMTISKAPVRMMGVEAVEKVWDAYVTLTETHAAMASTVAKLLDTIPANDAPAARMAFGRARRLWCAPEALIG